MLLFCTWFPWRGQGLTGNLFRDICSILNLCLANQFSTKSIMSMMQKPNATKIQKHKNTETPVIIYLKIALKGGNIQHIQRPYHLKSVTPHVFQHFLINQTQRQSKYKQMLNFKVSKYPLYQCLQKEKKEKHYILPQPLSSVEDNLCGPQLSYNKVNAMF